MRIRDELGELFSDKRFVSAFAALGRPGLAPGQLALVTALQFAGDLTDRQAGEAVRARIDWKYCLGLELDDPEFDFSGLSEFRTAGLAAIASTRARGRQGGRPRKMTPEKVAVARQMYTSQQFTVEQIAATLGVTRGTVYAHLHRTVA